jgi:hypothetical protein
MSKTDKQLRKFVFALMKYAEQQKEFNPGFTKEQIPQIFKGWDELQFNMVRFGAGIGCCGYIAPDQYSINIAHCNELKNRLRDSRRVKWRLIVAVAALVIALTGTTISILIYTNNYNQQPQKNQQYKNADGQIKQSSDNERKK